MYIETMFPDEFDRYILEAEQANHMHSPGIDRNNPGPIAVLPVGSVEQHGPHLLLGCDGFISFALAHMTAKKLGAVLYPMIPFSWIGGLRPFAGTIDLRPFITAEYMEQIGLGIFRQGFSRLVLVNCHGGGREMVFSVAKRLFKKTGKSVITEYPSNLYRSWPEIIDIWKENGMEYDWAAIEAAELSGALKYLGKNKIAEKVLQNTKDAVAEFGEDVQIPEQPGLQSAFRVGEVGHDYNHECMHVQPRQNINPEAGIKALDFMAEKLAWGTLHAEE